MRTKFTFFFAASLLFSVVNMQAQTEGASAPVDTSSSSVYEMSLEDLMNVQVSTGSLVSTSQFMTPSAVTTITAEDIEHSSYRNLLDIMESYVPGMFYMEHPSEGSKVGMRGIIADRNLKFLLLVNGMIIGDRGHRGVMNEIAMWDLSDIEKVEVIRGPGSVTYGPGAIQGVINITTKRATDKNYTSAGVNYTGGYNSKGFNFSQNVVNEKTGIKALTYGSMQFTKGYEANLFKIDNLVNTKDKSVGYSTATNNTFMADVENVPQIKINSDIDFGKDWKFFATYMQSSVTSAYQSKRGLFSGYNNGVAAYDGALEQSAVQRMQNVACNLSKKFKLTDQFSVFAQAIYDNENSRNFQYYKPSFMAPASGNMSGYNTNVFSAMTDKTSLHNILFNFSEQQITGKAIVYYKGSNDKLDAAIGFDVTHNTWAAPWGEASNRLRMGDFMNIVSDSSAQIFAPGKASVVENGKATTATLKPSNENWKATNQGVYVGKGWSTITYSVYGEAQYKFSPLFTILASARLDKDSYSSFLFSPRVTLMSQLADKNFLRLSLLQSNRMNTAEVMLLQHRKGVLSDPEKLTSLELLYTFVPTNKLTFDLAAYGNKTDILSWNNDLMAVTKTATASYLGVEPSINYKDKKLAVGVNHAFIKLLAFKRDSLATGNGISYADWQRPISFSNYNAADKITINGYGMNLSNYANHITKLYVTYAVLKERVVLHTDAHVLWGFEGYKDGLVAMQTALDNAKVSSTLSQEQLTQIRDNFTAVKAKLDEFKAYGIDMRLNASVSYKITDKFIITAYVQNLVTLNKAKRYFYDSGMANLSTPNRLAPYIEEPRVWGLRASCKF